MEFERMSHPSVCSTKMKRFPNFIGGLLVVTLTVASCQGNGSDRQRYDSPEKAAVDYVRNFYQGHADKCVDMMMSCDSASDEYKKVMSVLFKQSAHAKSKAGDSLLAVEMLQEEVGEKAANVFLKLSFNDHHVENIVVPLVWDGKSWRLR